MEMIFVLLFLGLTCGICVRLFAASYTARTKAREYDHIQELTVSAGEVLEGTDGTVEQFLQFFPNGSANGNMICYYFDKQWNNTEQNNAFYQMELTLTSSETEKKGALVFTKPGSGSNRKLYELTIRYPIVTEKNNVSKEEDLS